MNQNSKDIVVSVQMMAYNHEAFIAEAINGVLMQKTNFAFELVIGEDGSTDNTRDICLELQAKFPDIIKLNEDEGNIGANKNFEKTLNRCQGKYIAICEGDDYWTDPYKLQKQVDLMHNHPDYAMCAHAAQILMCNHFDESKIDKSVLTTEDIIREDWGIMTASILFRRDMFIIPDWYGKVKNGDYALQLLLSLKGNIGYLPDNMCVYRQHFGGVSSTLKPLNQAAWMAFLLYEFDNYTNRKYHKLIISRIKRMYNKLIYYAKGYGQRRMAVRLTFYKLLVPFAPFKIRSLRE